MSPNHRRAQPGARVNRASALAGLVVVLAGCTLIGCTVQSNAGPDGGIPADAGLSSDLRFTIEPLSPVLESVDGSTPSVALRVMAESTGGDRFEVTPFRWELDDDRLGDIDAQGIFTATGRAGGTVTARATVSTRPTATIVETTITVRIDVTVPPGPAAPRERIDDFDRLPSVHDPFRSVTLLYPLEGAVMPNNVRPPDLQWHPLGAAGDLFRIVLESEHVTVRAFVVHGGASFRSHYAIDSNTFRVIADSVRGGHVRIRVDRLPVGAEAVIAGQPITIELIEDGLFGTLYYWQVRTAPQASDVFRLHAASGERTSVFASTSESDCVGCHTVSHDGRHLAATRNGPGGWFTEVVDVASQTTPPPTYLGPLPAYHTLAWSPTGTRALASRPLAIDRNDTRLFLLDASNGAELPASGLPSVPAGQPTWSPDGKLVAWMEGGGDGPDGTDARTRIVIAEVDGDSFAPRVLHDGGDLADSPEGGLTDSHPTFSPDSRFIAFAHGTRSVSSGTSNAERSRSALYLIPVDGGEPIRLDRGMGPEGPVDAFWPVFSPFVTQDSNGRLLYWLAFYSRQAYGNEHAGTAGARRRQLWLMAIDPAIASHGLDPSHPPYWIPGQDVAADDIAAHWAPTACLPQGEECNASSECCSGHCGPVGELEELRCLPPQGCRQAGESCETADDCCGTSVCNLNVCGYQPPF